jgi:hypothetical protein
LAAIILGVEIFPDEWGDAQPDVEGEEMAEELEIECSVRLDGTDLYANTSFTI